MKISYPFQSFRASTNYGSRLAAFVALLVSASTLLAQYDSDGVRLGTNFLLSQLPGAPSSGSGTNGYVSASGREYAIFGQSNGTTVIEVTDPFNARIVDFVQGRNSLWHEQTVMGDYAYLGTEAGGGMQIVDLRNVDNNVVTLAATYTGSGLSSIHTLRSNPESKTVYLNGSNVAGGSLVALDASNPTAPVFAGAWGGRYVHDSLIVTYKEGPYAGKEIAFCDCGGAGLYILDVTNKAAMTVIGSNEYISSGGYSHSSTISQDKKTLYVNDEFDESNQVVPSATTWVFDISNLSNPTLIRKFSTGKQFIDHNSYLVDNIIYLAAYRGGLRLYEAQDPGAMKEIGYFDTYPGSDGFSYNGDWGLHVFPSGNVVLSDLDRGFFVVDPSEGIGLGPNIMKLTFDRGTLVSGLQKNLRKDDNVYFVTKIGPAPFNSEPLMSRYTLSLNSTKKSFTLADVRIDAMANVAGNVSVRAELYNWTSAQFEQVGQWPLTTSDTSYTVTGLSSSTYVNAAKDIQLRVTTLATGPLFSNNVQTSYDVARVTLR